MMSDTSGVDLPTYRVDAYYDWSGGGTAPGDEARITVRVVEIPGIGTTMPFTDTDWQPPEPATPRRITPWYWPTGRVRPRAVQPGSPNLPNRLVHIIQPRAPPELQHNRNRLYSAQESELYSQLHECLS